MKTPKPLRKAFDMRLRYIRSGLALAVLLACAWCCHAAGAQEQPDVAAWATQVEQQAPSHPTAPVPDSKPRSLLVFSLATGYQHTVIPYVDQVFQILSRKSGAMQVTISRDIEDLRPKTWAGTTCWSSTIPVLSVPAATCSWMSWKRTRATRACRNSNARSVPPNWSGRSSSSCGQGKGLVAMHGAPTLLNNSEQFTQMVGGAFDYHPPSQQVTVRVVEPAHPLTAAFQGREPLVHRDEPYCFKGAYDCASVSAAAGFRNGWRPGPTGSVCRPDALRSLDQAARQGPRVFLLTRSLCGELHVTHAPAVSAGRCPVCRRRSKGRGRGNGH